MKTLFIKLFTLFFLTNNLSAQNLNALFKEAERLELIPNETAALLKYESIIKLDLGNIKALSKCSELCCRIGKRQTNVTTRDEFYNAALTFAQTAVKLAPLNSNANCSMAMVLGHISMNKSNKEKIASAKDLKKYVDLALQEDGNNCVAWHILGRWNYEISNLNMFERAAVKVLYGGLPKASLQSSIEAFEIAKSLSGKNFVINYFELAKAYKKNNQKTKAINTLNEMFTIPNQTESDSGIKEEGKKLLSSLK